MPIVCGAGVSYSPLMYRQQSAWPDISRYLVGNVIQPNNRDREDEALLDSYAERIQSSLQTISSLISNEQLDALIVLHADRGDVFDESNTPQLHIQVGGEVWGDNAIRQLGEKSQVVRFACDEAGAELLIEELVRLGFDVSEGRAAFNPLGLARRGIGPAVAEAVSRLAYGLPIIPVHVNCYIQPSLAGERLQKFGQALASVAQLTDRRLGLLVTGGLSGDPNGPMAGWIDDVLDEWVLSRLVRRQSSELAGVWGARSRTLNGSSAAIRLWTVAAAAFEQTNCQARIIDYMPVHHGAAGIGFVAWENA